MKSTLVNSRMTPDATKLLDEGVMVYERATAH